MKMVGCARLLDHIVPKASLKEFQQLYANKKLESKSTNQRDGHNAKPVQNHHNNQ